MSRQLSILIFIIFAFVNSYANAGDDGNLKLNENKNGYVEVGDCFEKVNRGIFGFNQVLDKVIFKPLAKGYRMFPQPIRSGTSNALSNIGNVVTVPNNVLQGQFKDAGINSARFVINSTLGIAGIFDVASYYGLKKRDKEDYGQTLGVWGAGAGCYFVLPVLGPTTVRDSFGMIVDNRYLDAFAKVTWHEKEIKKMSGNKLDYVGIKAASAVDFRGDNMINFESLEKNSIDLYAATKSLYIQDRTKKIKNKESSDDDSWGELDK